MRFDMLTALYKKIRKNKSLLGYLMRSLKSCIHLLLCLSFLAPTLIACSDDEEYTQRRGVSRRNRKFKNTSNNAKGSKAQGGTTSDTIQIPVHLKRKILFSPSGWANTKQIRSSIQSARDPFQPDIIELKDQEEIKVDPTSLQRNLVVKVPILVQNLTFTGSLTGAEINSAMLEDKSGMGYTVQTGDVIGKSPEFVRVQRITTNEIKFEPILGISSDEDINSPKLVKRLREIDTNKSLEQTKGMP